MFKVFKYIFLLTLYKKAKKSFLMLAVYAVVLILLSLMFSDFISIASGMSLYVLIFAKWASVVLLLILIAITLAKIFSLATTIFEKSEDTKELDVKKEKILAKEKLSTKSDLILQKYMKKNEK